MEQNDVLAAGDPDSAEAHPPPPPQRLGVQQSIGHRI
jgi:hypothetical protein